MKKTITVFHLVRKINGLEPFLRFIGSYKKNYAGINHDFVIVYKGFSGRDEIVLYEEQLINLPHKLIYVDDTGFDIGTYIDISCRVGSDYICFLNSFSVILNDLWLLKFINQLNKSHIGIVGSTGSAGSLRQTLKVKTREFIAENDLASIAMKVISYPFRAIVFFIFFPPFPNYHVRTNAFVVKRNLMIRIKAGKIYTKIHAYFMESGFRSITRQIKNMGFDCVIVDSAGKAYKENNWKFSKTFWTGEQENLLISDNQTEKYMKASASRKLFFEKFAWGDK